MSDTSEPDFTIVEKFTDSEEGLPEGFVPEATLAMLWYVGPNGEHAVAYQLDGDIQVSSAVGDIFVTMHKLVHEGLEET